MPRIRRRVLINLTDQQIKLLDSLVQKRTYDSRSEIIRDAITQLLEKKKIEEIERKLSS